MDHAEWMSLSGSPEKQPDLLLSKAYIAGIKKGFPDKEIRTFETGATRDSDDGKYDYEGFLSPLVLVRFAEYMHKNRVQSDGSMRASDNWQKGFPLEAYMKSMWRHFMDVWLEHRGSKSDTGATIEESLCGVLFNAMGYLHEILKKE